MNVGELIAKLQELPPDMPVVWRDNSDWGMDQYAAYVTVDNWRDYGHYVQRVLPNDGTKYADKPVVKAVSIE